MFDGLDNRWHEIFANGGEGKVLWQKVKHEKRAQKVEASIHQQLQSPNKGCTVRIQGRN